MAKSCHCFARLVTALIAAEVKGDQSWINLTADDIHLNGNVIATMLTTDNAKIGGWSVYSGKLTSESTESYDDEESEFPIGWTRTKRAQIDGQNQSIELQNIY